MSQSRWMGFLLALAATLVAAYPVLAVDGVIEINQSRALAGGITPGDGPGFPVQISVSGSYRLTSDLNGAAGFDGIDVAADNVTIDLNGFTIYGLAGGITDGISLGVSKNVEIKNGTVRGFTRDGIFTAAASQFIRVINVRVIGNLTFGIDLEGQGNTIEGCTALNSNTGMRAFDGSLVTDSVARGNSSFGLVLNGPSGYRSCVFTSNNGGDANPQVSGGFQLGTNVCGADTVCP
ncbi:MAG TPA: right-handed parallel beta-helix repeat-containing protein [Candidatus Polarisedimenticolaceae bacterium]|nr:right-handed parallel beta-helix repeat-containing protein [Candidatus Polarisedimenticolaceae bacterium]